MYKFDAQEIEDATDGFSPSRLIGKGSHGSVYSGVLKDGRRVAVKKESSALRALKDPSKLLNEALILSSVPPNPCTVAFLGADAAALVTELMPNGNLHHLLHHAAAPPPPWHRRLRIALQLAGALRHLHGSNPCVVHRDVKSANILFDGEWNAKLADFGLAISLRGDDDVAESKLPAGTMGYIDPGYTTPCKLSAKIDVFSYGVVLLELVSARRAIDVTKSPASIVDWAVPLIKEGRGLEICDGRIRHPSLHTSRAISKLLEVAARCVSPKESERPSMKEVAENLESLQIDPNRRYLYYVREMIRSMMNRRKSRVSEQLQCGVIVTSSACGESNGNSNNFSKGRLLREILADITLK